MKSQNSKSPAVWVCFWIRWSHHYYIVTYFFFNSKTQFKVCSIILVEKFFKCTVKSKRGSKKTKMLDFQNRIAVMLIIDLLWTYQKWSTPTKVIVLSPRCPLNHYGSNSKKSITKGNRFLWWSKLFSTPSPLNNAIKVIYYTK